MGAATLTGKVSHLILYEPGLGIRYPRGWLDANEQALRAGDAEGVIRAVLTDILQMSEEDVEAAIRTLKPNLEPEPGTRTQSSEYRG